MEPRGHDDASLVSSSHSAAGAHQYNQSYTTRVILYLPSLPHPSYRGHDLELREPPLGHRQGGRVKAHHRGLGDEPGTHDHLAAARILEPG